jgi:hypothetical protein
VTSNKPKKYLRKSQVMERYGYANPRPFERAQHQHIIPYPDLYRGQIPLWDEAKLDSFDAAQEAAAQAAREAATARGHRAGDVSPRSKRKNRGATDAKASN